MSIFSPFRLLALVLLATILPLPAADTYRIDPSHSEVGFRIRHLISKVPGRFVKFQGTIRVDEANIAKSSVEVVIETASINTDNVKRDEHLRAADFFDAEKFPAITFRSSVVKEVAKGRLEVTGELSMHGVAKNIVIPVVMLGVMKSPFNDTRGGFEGNLKLNRNDFGIKAYPGVLGDEVEITLNIEAVKIETK